MNGHRAVRACNHCENGTLCENEQTGEVICDSCFIAPAPTSVTTVAEKQRERRQRRLAYSRDEEYPNGTTRLIGGYERGYYSWVSGPEYAIDTYGDVTEGLLVPHKRNWSRSSP